MITAVVVGNIEKVGPDYIWWRNGADKRQVNFADNWAMTKEDWAASFRGLVGKPAAIPVGGPFFIAVDFLPGIFEGTVRVIQSTFPVASVERL
ncbi:MAG: hypothetical protein LAN18_00675 [Acidobacteriia bacterium]|nr:hypothetical protein [Terriglobia bacterium]